MVRAISLPARFVTMFLLGAPLLAQSIPNWTAPRYWSGAERTPIPGKPDSGGFRLEGTLPTTPTSPLPFVAINPCRLVDTRQPGFPVGFGQPSLVGGVPRDFDLDSDPLCTTIPESVAAYSLNITVTNTQGPGFILIFPRGEAQPLVSTLNYSGGQTIANAAVVPAGINGGVTVIAGVSGTDLIVDVNGFYSPGVALGNTFLGVDAGNFTMTGCCNTGIGEVVLQPNSTGAANTAVGFAALHFNDAGAFNTAIGASALFSNTNGLENTALGTAALAHNTTGGNNIAIGREAGINLTNGTDNIDIGNPGIAGESATIRIGDSVLHTRAFLAGVRDVATGAADGLTVLIDSNGQLGTVSSSASVKREISGVGEASSPLLKLRPVSFFYRDDAAGIRQYGLIAEEVAQVMPELVQFSPNGKAQTIRYHFLAPLLLNELQKEHRRNEEQNVTIESLRARLDALEARRAGVEAPTR